MKGWRAPDRGALFVISGASGSGKTTLVQRVFARVPGLEFSVSVTTRPARPGERDGVDYHFIDAARYASLREEGALLEHAEVYGRAYGTPREPVVRALAEGRSIVLDIDVQGAAQVRTALPEAVSIFILPPSIATLHDRLVARGTDSPEVIDRRMREAREQLERCGEYEYLIVNDVLDTASACLEGVFWAELSRRERRGALVRSMAGV